MNTTTMYRRDALLALTGGFTFVLAPLLAASCGTHPKNGNQNTDSNNTPTTDAKNPNGTADPNQVTPAGTIDGSTWATGGTAVMLATAQYPNPFQAGSDAVCNLTCQATAGPCYLAQGAPPVRQDISEKQDGLPMRLMLRLVDSSCVAIVGAQVELWHCSPNGLYSGQTPNPKFCSNNDATALAAQWFRGTATSDASGVVTFDSCFPGWYTSRTIHIHFTVTTSTNDSVTTQFFFPDAICDGIVANQPLYKDRGARDTNNQNDTVVSASAAPAYCFDVAQMSDGAMLASKTIVLRSSSSDSLCTIPSGSKSTTGATGKAPGGPMPGTKLHRTE